MSRRSILIAGLIAILVLLSAVWFVNNYERVDSEYEVEFTDEAWTNRYFAAKLLLRRMGYDARSITITTLKTTLPPTTDMLIITTSRKTLRQKESTDILSWVQAGGDLVLQPATLPHIDNLDTDEDPILGQIGIKGYFDSDMVWPDVPDSYSFSASSNELEIFFDSYYQLDGDTDADRIFFDPNGVHMIQRSHGKGTVTVLSDMEFLTNTSIGEYDHARFLVELSEKLSGEKQTIWILNNEHMPSILSLLWNHSRAIVTVFFFTLALWLSGSFFRFGPLIPQPQPSRRQLLEHIDASGKYFWKNKQKDRLVNSVKSALQKKLSSLVPGWNHLSATEKQQHMSEMLNMPDNVLKQLLIQHPDIQPGDFTRLIRQLDNARKQL